MAEAFPGLLQEVQEEVEGFHGIFSQCPRFLDQHRLSSGRVGLREQRLLVSAVQGGTRRSMRQTQHRTSTDTEVVAEVEEQVAPGAAGVAWRVLGAFKLQVIKGEGRVHRVPVPVRTELFSAAAAVGFPVGLPSMEVVVVLVHQVAQEVHRFSQEKAGTMALQEPPLVAEVEKPARALRVQFASLFSRPKVCPKPFITRQRQRLSQRVSLESIKFLEFFQHPRTSKPLQVREHGQNRHNRT